MGVAGAVAGTFGIQPLVGAFGVPYQAAEPRDERQIRVPLRNSPPNVTGCLPSRELFGLLKWLGSTRRILVRPSLATLGSDEPDVPGYAG